ncbi:MAG: PolC-type DNA polymerase III, partial [Acutalibacteraceae bacterium]
IGTRDNIMIHLIHQGVEEGMAFKITEIVRKGKATKLLTEEHIQVMREHGVPDWYIDSCMKIKYMFPKAHAAAYMISALRMGWYKVYRPLEYYAAYFTVRSEGIDAETVVKPVDEIKKAMQEIEAKGKDATANDAVKKTMLQIIVEMKYRGIEFLPVDFQKSRANMYVVEDGKIRLPFSSVSGIGGNAAESLEEAAKIGGFISQDDIIQNTGVTKSVLESLCAIGAINLPKSNQISLF